MSDTCDESFEALERDIDRQHKVGRCIGNRGNNGCGYEGGKSGDTCPKCGGMLLSREAEAKADAVYLNELKPCPFCGGRPVIERKGDRSKSMIIGCEDCGCNMESPDEYGTTAIKNWHWNHRK